MGGHKWVPQRRGFPFYGVSAFARNWKWGAPPDAFTLSPLHLLATVTFLLAASLLFAPATPPSSVAPSTSTPRVRRSEAGFLELPMRYALRWYVWYALFFLTLFCVFRVVMFYAEQFCALFAFVFLGRTRFKRSTALGISLILILLAFVPSASAMPTGVVPISTGDTTTTTSISVAISATATFLVGTLPAGAMASEVSAPRVKRPNAGRFGPCGRDPRSYHAAAPCSPTSAPPSKRPTIVRGAPLPPSSPLRSSPSKSSLPGSLKTSPTALSSLAAAPALPAQQMTFKTNPEVTFNSFFGLVRRAVSPLCVSPPPKKSPTPSSRAVAPLRLAAPFPASFGPAHLSELAAPLAPRTLDFSSPAAPPSTVSALFEDPPLTIVTHNGTATLRHAHGSGFAWDFNPLVCGELVASTFLSWVRPFIQRDASSITPTIDDSTLLVELVRVESRPLLSVCLAVTQGSASIITVRHNLESKGTAAARVGDALRKHDNPGRHSLVVDDVAFAKRYKVYLGVGALFRGGGGGATSDKTPGFVERLALQCLGVASPAAVLAAVSLNDPQPPFTLPLREYKPAAALLGEQASIVPVLLGAASSFTSPPISKGPRPAPGSGLSTVEAAALVKDSLRAAVAGAKTVYVVAPVADAVLGSGPQLTAPAGGLFARVLSSASERQVLEAVRRAAPHVDAKELG